MKPIPVGTLVKLSSAAHDSYGCYDGYPIRDTKKWIGIVLAVKEPAYSWCEENYIVKWINRPSCPHRWVPHVRRKDLKYAKLPKLLKNQKKI